MKKAIIICLLTCVILLGVFSVSRRWTGDSSSSGSTSVVSVDTALLYLASINDDKAGSSDNSGYRQGYQGRREVVFGKAWLDVDGNGCDTRNDILGRDLTFKDYDKHTTGLQENGIGKGVYSCPNATVYSGVLHDPYTGVKIDFVRGQETSELVQIDHVVPLAYAYKHGGWKLFQEGKTDILIRFANDPVNLLAVSGAANQEKKAAGPSGWLPSKDSQARCDYALRFTTVIKKYNEYGLSLDLKDRGKLIETIKQDCNYLL
ncbi:MAG: HNH endonuclease family protein [Arcanobacterium sp.]|nr:HNH endonuclease family protein [Arcanobacterium sp.]